MAELSREKGDATLLDTACVIGQVEAFRIALGMLGLMHGLQLLRWGYHEALSGERFILPLVDALAVMPKAAHLLIYYGIVVAAILVIFGILPRVASGVLALAFLYTELFDRQAFHHDIFLAANLFLCLTLVLSRNKSTQETGVVCIKILAIVVYLFAGINKISFDYLEGSVCEGILGSSFVGRLIVGNVPFAPVVFSLFSLIGELLVPFLLLSSQARLKLIGILLGTCLHLGILLLGRRGILFNFYVPTMYMAFFQWQSTIACVVRRESGRNTFTAAMSGSIVIVALSLAYLGCYCLIAFRSLLASNSHVILVIFVVGFLCVMMLCVRQIAARYRSFKPPDAIP